MKCAAGWSIYDDVPIALPCGNVPLQLDVKIGKNRIETGAAAHMTLNLTTEQLQTLQAKLPPVFVHDPATHQRYVILPQAEYARLLDYELRIEIQRGIDDAESGNVKEWNLQEIIAEAKRRCGQ